jgi:hypothetical protein
MPGKSTYLTDGVLNYLFRGGSLAAPGTVYVSLHNADPTDANVTSTELTIGTNGYARASYANGSGQWNAPATSGADRVISNVNAINFPSPTGDWNSANPIGYVGIYDAATGGNLLYSTQLGTARTVLSTDNAPQVAAGALVIHKN